MHVIYESVTLSEIDMMEKLKEWGDGKRSDHLQSIVMHAFIRTEKPRVKWEKP